MAQAPVAAFAEDFAVCGSATPELPTDTVIVIVIEQPGSKVPKTFSRGDGSTFGTFKTRFCPDDQPFTCTQLLHLFFRILDTIACLVFAFGPSRWVRKHRSRYVLVAVMVLLNDHVAMAFPLGGKMPLNLTHPGLKYRYANEDDHVPAGNETSSDVCTEPAASHATLDCCAAHRLAQRSSLLPTASHSAAAQRCVYRLAQHCIVALQTAPHSTAQPH